MGKSIDKETGGFDYPHTLSIIYVMKNCHRNLAALAMESSNHLGSNEKKTLVQSKGAVSERLLTFRAERLKTDKTPVSESEATAG